MMSFGCGNRHRAQKTAAATMAQPGAAFILRGDKSRRKWEFGRRNVIPLRSVWRTSMHWILNYCLLAAFGRPALAQEQGDGKNFTVDRAVARKFRVREVVLTGDGSVANPFDAHFGPEMVQSRPGDAKSELREVTFPNSCDMVREVGTFFQKNDPWRHPISAGPARGVALHFDKEEWVTYVHLEDSYDVSAKRYEQYHALGKPVFLGEDRYEQDHPGTYDPHDMRYFQRHLFWAWLFSGGSANYGGRWWVLHPYTQTGQRPAPSIHHKEFTYQAPLTGLDSVKAIHDYFGTRRIELSDFVPDHMLTADPDGVPVTRAPKLMRRRWVGPRRWHGRGRGAARPHSPLGRRRRGRAPTEDAKLKGASRSLAIYSTGGERLWREPLSVETFPSGS